MMKNIQPKKSFLKIFLVIFILVILAILSFFAFRLYQFSKSANIQVVAVPGDTLIRRPWEKKSTQAKNEEVMVNAETVIRSQKTSVIITFEDKTTITLSPNSIVQVYSSKKGSSLKLYAGRIEVNHNPNKIPDRYFHVQTSTFIASTVGTDFAIGLDENSTSVFVRQGRIEVRLYEEEDFDLPDEAIPEGPLIYTVRYTLVSFRRPEVGYNPDLDPVYVASLGVPPVQTIRDGQTARIENVRPPKITVDTGPSLPKVPSEDGRDTAAANRGLRDLGSVETNLLTDQEFFQKLRDTTEGLSEDQIDSYMDFSNARCDYINAHKNQIISIFERARDAEWTSSTGKQKAQALIDLYNTICSDNVIDEAEKQRLRELTGLSRQ